MVNIFKTSVKTEKDILKLKPYLNELLSFTKWNFDLEDCDNIFRIESDDNILEDICKIFQTLGYNCEELLDQ
jgi:hypothetical protein